MKEDAVPDLSEAQAVAVVLRSFFGLAVVFALVIPASIRDHRTDIEATTFRAAMVATEESALQHRRDAFESRRLAYQMRNGRHIASAVAAMRP